MIEKRLTEEHGMHAIEPICRAVAFIAFLYFMYRLHRDC